MKSQNWLMSLQSAEKTCLIQDGKRKVHYKFPDGKEMVEEYNLETNIVVKRAWKVCKKFGAQPQWDVEVGDPDVSYPEDLDNIGISETSTAPFITKRITKSNLEWRIRNLPYPVETYSVTADPDKNCITVKTTNKKFFKNIPVLDLERLGLKPQQDRIEFSHKFNTLIISYKKPPELMLAEKLILEEVAKLKSIKEDQQCAQQ